MRIQYSRTKNGAELRQVLALQQKNMANVLSPKEVLEEGFITIGHTLEILEKMNKACPHVIAKDNGKVVGYALVMLPDFRDEIPMLRPMFTSADLLLPCKKYVAMGQICIAKSHRKQGIFRGMYHYYRAQLRNDFDCLFTEIASTNKRSLEAHMAIGFKVVKSQITNGVSWELVNWDWH